MKFDNQHEQANCARRTSRALSCYVSVDDCLQHVTETLSCTFDGTQSVSHHTCLGHAQPLSLQENFSRQNGATYIVRIINSVKR